MATLITEKGLKELIAIGVIKGNEKSVEGIKYDFRLGNRFLKAKHKTPANISDFGPTEREEYTVEPGETVFVITEEILDLPKEIKAELSHKRKLSHEGIQVLGGFCIDPLYKGHLIFGMYNFGSRPFILEHGRKLIAAQFYKLSEDEQGDFPTPTPLDDFPDELIQIAKGMDTVSLQGLGRKIDTLTNKLEALRHDFDTREDWFNKLQKSLEAIKEAVDKTQGNLERERIERQTGQSKLQELIDSHDKALKEVSKLTVRHKLIMNLAFWVGSVVVATVIIWTIGQYFTQSK